MEDEARERARVIHKILREIWDSRPGLRAAKKLRLAALKTPEGKELKPITRESEVTEWVRDEPRRQAFYRPKQEWPGRNQISNAPGVRLNADLLDWSEITPNPAANAGYKFCALRSRCAHALCLRSTC